MTKFAEMYKYLRFTAVIIGVAILLASTLKAEIEFSPEIAIRNSGLYDYFLEHGIGDSASQGYERSQEKDNSAPDKD